MAFGYVEFGAYGDVVLTLAGVVYHVSQSVNPSPMEAMWEHAAPVDEQMPALHVPEHDAGGVKNEHAGGKVVGHKSFPCGNAARQA